ncbi:MFS transporter [Croceivirga sp. JEA036]|uniref:MFS transporter n=1 Tax=Croceivirga sp. JEA036 TaxID=2721162 RepID=UPI00143C60B8|nr:MFS transporter [Croceivirga sp. JEA036]NJB35216.1 MFS transporter [Croceivirga sp. JEA036]
MITTEKRKKRYGILAMVFFTVVINYLDRSNISVAASALSEDLELDSVKMGLIFSAFAWTYAGLQIPGGLIVDRVKARVLYTIMLITWSIATLLQGLANSFGALLGLRAAIGVFEAPSYPTNNAIVTKWFPENERASAIAIYTSGQYIGLAFLTPLLVAIQDALGWRGLFIVSGIIGIVWGVLWYVLYRDPVKTKDTNNKEVAKVEKESIQWHQLKYAFTSRKLWGLYIGQFCLGTLAIFFLTWFPTYLVKYRGLDFLESGFLASIPFLAAFFGVLLAGFTSDFLVKKGFSTEIARKAPVIGGTLLSTIIIGANYTDNTTLIIAFLALAFFGNGFASITWVFISLMAPKNLIGLTGGVFNFIGGLSAVVTPVVIGYLVKEGDFSPALLYISMVALVGFLAYVFLVGSVKRIEIDKTDS